MSGKRIKPQIRQYITWAWENQTKDLDLIATKACCSRRSVLRILEEAGIDPGIKRRPGKAKEQSRPETVTHAWIDYPGEAETKASEPLPAFHTIEVPPGTIQIIKTQTIPWYQRMAANIKNFFKFA